MGAPLVDGAMGRRLHSRVAKSMIGFFDLTDAPATGAFSRAAAVEVPTAAKVAFACIALGPDAVKAP